MLAFAATLLVAACNNATDKSIRQESNTNGTSAMAAKPKDSLSAYTAKILNSKKDNVCGMPLSASITDTVKKKCFHKSLETIRFI